MVSERTSHCILPWQPTDRCRCALTMRYYSSDAYRARVDRGSPTDPELLDPATRVEILALSTRAMIDGVGIRAWEHGASAAVRL